MRSMKNAWSPEPLECPCTKSDSSVVLGRGQAVKHYPVFTVSLGRKNWIHIGSAQAGLRIAAILSVVESCRRLNIPVREYLAAVLPGLADLPIQRLSDLTPAAWATQHS
jgi:hypothetical protein